MLATTTRVVAMAVFSAIRFSLATPAMMAGEGFGLATTGIAKTVGTAEILGSAHLGENSAADVSSFEPVDNLTDEVRNADIGRAEGITVEEVRVGRDETTSEAIARSEGKRTVSIPIGLILLVIVPIALIALATLLVLPLIGRRENSFVDQPYDGEDDGGNGGVAGVYKRAEGKRRIADAAEVEKKRIEKLRELAKAQSRAKAEAKKAQSAHIIALPPFCKRIAMPPHRPQQ